MFNVLLHEPTENMQIVDVTARSSQNTIHLSIEEEDVCTVLIISGCDLCVEGVKVQEELVPSVLGLNRTRIDTIEHRNNLCCFIDVWNSSEVDEKPSLDEPL